MHHRPLTTATTARSVPPRFSRGAPTTGASHFTRTERGETSPRPIGVRPLLTKRACQHIRTGRSVQPRGARSVQPYGRQVVLIVHDVVSLCQPEPVRFTPVQARRSSRVTGSAYGSCPFSRFVQEEGFPVGSYKSSVFGASSMGGVAASTASLLHPLSEVVDNSVDGGFREGVVPCGGTGFKIFARLTGAHTVPAALRPLSTGVLRQAAEMISISYFRVGL